MHKLNPASLIVFRIPEKKYIYFLHACCIGKHEMDTGVLERISQTQTVLKEPGVTAISKATEEV